MSCDVGSDGTEEEEEHGREISLSEEEEEEEEQEEEGEEQEEEEEEEEEQEESARCHHCWGVFPLSQWWEATDTVGICGSPEEDHSSYCLDCTRSVCITSWQAGTGRCCPTTRSWGPRGGGDQGAKVLVQTLITSFWSNN